LTWGLYRRPNGVLAVDFDAFADLSNGRKLATFLTRPEAVEARIAQERADEIEALREAGQKDLFNGDGDAA